jgi:hypothetical protein
MLEDPSQPFIDQPSISHHAMSLKKHKKIEF